METGADCAAHSQTSELRPRRLKPQDLQKKQSPRERLHIQIQVYLQRRQSVLLKTPRWSEPHTFWQRALKTTPNVRRLLPPPPHFSLPLQWRQLLAQFGLIVQDDPVLKVVAERGGFRQALIQAIEGIEDPILISQAERWPLTMLSDIQLRGRIVPKQNAQPYLWGGHLEEEKWITNFGFRIFLPQKASEC